MIIINPPYGERLDEESNLEPLYQNMGDILRDYTHSQVRSISNRYWSEERARIIRITSVGVIIFKFTISIYDK